MIKLSKVLFDQGAFTGKAIKFAREQLFAETERTDAKKVFLVITDGKADDPEVLEEEADLLTTEDIISFAVGVRTKTDLDNDELSLITADHLDRFFYLNQGTQQLTESFAELLATRICMARI